MINLTHFSPIGRIFTFFLEKAKQANYPEVRVVIEDLDYNQTLQVSSGSNREVFDTTLQRAKFLDKDVVEGEVLFGGNGTEIISRHFKVLNCLYTDQPIEDEASEFTYKGSTTYGDLTKIVNGTHDTKDIPYKESLDVDYSLNFDMADEGVTDDCRPLYAFKFLGLVDGEYVILGPAKRKVMPIIAKQNYDGKVFNICCDPVIAKNIGVFLSKSDHEPVTGSEPKDNKAVRIILRSGDNEELFVLKTKPLTVFGHKMGFDEMLKLIKYGIYCEDCVKHHTANSIPGFDPERMTLVVDIERTGELWYISDIQQRYFREYVSSNSVCQQLDSHYASNNDSLFLKDGSIVIPISWDNSVKASAALSFSYWMSLFGYGTWTEFMFNTWSLYKKGYLVRSEDGDLMLSKTLFTPSTVYLNSNISTIVFRDFKLVEVKDIGMLNDYCLFAYDRDDDIIEGKPENYAVALVRDGLVTNVYDPYPIGNWKSFGDDLTPFLKATDTRVYDIEASSFELGLGPVEGGQKNV
jgi:hypothetical protein